MFVPRGVMTRSGRVSITEVRRGVYDFHIGVPWHGTVRVSLPLPRRRHDAVLHDVGGIWVPESPHYGVQRVWVSQLSSFTTWVTKAAEHLKGVLCLTWNRQAFIKCMVEHAIGYVDRRAANWIISHLPESCMGKMITAGLLAGGPLAVFETALNEPPCVGSASSSGWHYPTGPSDQAPTANSPVSSPGGAQTTGGTASQPTVPLPAGDYRVMNASGGIYWRSGPDWNTPEAVPGNGFYPATVIAVQCYQAGGADVPDTTDGMWEQATWVSGPGSGHGWINEHFINDGAALNQPSPGAPACSTSQSGGSSTPETAGGVTHTWTDYSSAGGTQGQSIQPGQTVNVTCRVQGFSVADGDAWWYQIASSPWDGTYYASADAFYNDGATSGSLSGTPLFDTSVPTCPVGTSPTAQTYSETAGGVAHTWTDYTDGGGVGGPSIQAGQTVQIACRVNGLQVADGNTWWYRIASSPWNGSFYASADAFYNDGATSGSLLGTPFVDPNIANC